MAVVVGEVDIDVETGREGNRVVSVKGKITDLSYYKGEESKYMQALFQPLYPQYGVLRRAENRKVRAYDREPGCLFRPLGFCRHCPPGAVGNHGCPGVVCRSGLFCGQHQGGRLCVRDVFNLYRYDDVLYTMRLTGQEIKDMLEMSYGLWTAQMKTPDDHVMLWTMYWTKAGVWGSSIWPTTSIRLPAFVTRWT